MNINFLGPVLPTDSFTQMAFVKEANELQKVAATGDAAAIKAQFGKTGESCKACHDKFRKDE
jgi:cytochrome c556